MTDPNVRDHPLTTALGVSLLRDIPPTGKTATPGPEIAEGQRTTMPIFLLVSRWQGAKRHHQNGVSLWIRDIISRRWLAHEMARVLFIGLAIIAGTVLSGCSRSNEPLRSFEPFIGSGTTPEGVRYYIDGSSSVIEIRGTSRHSTFKYAVLRFYCNSADLSGDVGANVLAYNRHRHLRRLKHVGSAHFDKTRPFQNYGFTVRRDVAVTRDPRFYEDAKHARIFEMALHQGSPDVEFDLTYAFNTPMQENLDRCGEY